VGGKQSKFGTREEEWGGGEEEEGEGGGGGEGDDDEEGKGKGGKFAQRKMNSKMAVIMKGTKGGKGRKMSSTQNPSKRSAKSGTPVGRKRGANGGKGGGKGGKGGGKGGGGGKKKYKRN
jgi:hypothetical protein